MFQIQNSNHKNKSLITSPSDSVASRDVSPIPSRSHCCFLEAETPIVLGYHGLPVDLQSPGVSNKESNLDLYFVTRGISFCGNGSHHVSCKPVSNCSTS